MPVYDFGCINCNQTTEIKMSLQEHSEMKDSLICPTCHGVLSQVVASLKFKLEGAGWFGSSDTCVDPYGITETEVRNNLDFEKRIDEGANVYRSKEKDKERQG